MNFPIINNINEVLPHLEGRKEFKVTVRDECTTIDYVFQEPTTFELPILKECRGLKFCNTTGEVIARPFQKFFNLGEKPDEEKGRDYSSAQVWEKVDGSLLHFILHNGEVRACTKAGITDVSKQAEDELNLSPEFLLGGGNYLDMGFTPCFEYTSPNNRIVVRYKEAKLVLLAVRDNLTGEYLTDIKHIASKLGIEATKQYKEFTLQAVREWKEREGVVLVWRDGYRLKVKADDYVLRHRVKDDVSREHRLLEIILNDGVDDLVGIVDDEDYQRILTFQQSVLQGLEITVKSVDEMLDKTSGMERKDVAGVVKQCNKPFQTVFWLSYDGKDPREVLVGYLLKNVNKQVNVDKVRGLYER